MRMRRFLSVSLSLLSVLLIVFSVASIDAHALTGGRYMTPQETLQIFGDSFAGKFYNGSGYTDVTFRYNTITKVSSCDWSDPDSYFVQGLDVLVYSASCFGLNVNSNYVTVDVTPEYSLFDFDILFTNIGVSNALTQNVSAYQTPFWDWVINGQSVHFEGTSTIPATGIFPKTKLQNDTNKTYIFCPVSYTNQSTVSGYSLRAGFYGAGTYSSTLLIYIACPYITTNATGQSGTFTTTTSVSQGDINVNVDMTETNTLLGGIASLISGLADNIADLFIPEQNTLEVFENDLVDLLLDTFGGIESDMLDGLIQDLLTHGATESVTWPAIQVPGTRFSLPSYNVPLKPAASQNRALYEAVALAIDLVSTAAVINLIMHNIKVFLVGEKVVEIEDAD